MNDDILDQIDQNQNMSSYDDSDSDMDIETGCDDPVSRRVQEMNQQAIDLANRVKKRHEDVSCPLLYITHWIHQFAKSIFQHFYYSHLKNDVDSFGMNVVGGISEPNAAASSPLVADLAANNIDENGVVKEANETAESDASSQVVAQESVGHDAQASHENSKNVDENDAAKEANATAELELPFPVVTQENVGHDALAAHENSNNIDEDGTVKEAQTTAEPDAVPLVVAQSAVAPAAQILPFMPVVQTAPMGIEDILGQAFQPFKIRGRRPSEGFVKKLSPLHEVSDESD